MKKIWYRRNGYIIENINYDRYLMFHLIKKALAFATDLAIYAIVMFVLTVVFNMAILYSFIISYFLFFLCTTSAMLLLKNKTIGMALAGLRIGYMDGTRVTTGRLLNRAFITSIYAIPVVGWILALTSAISAFVNKGITPVDLFTKTQVYNKNWHKNVLDVLDSLEKGK